MFGIVGVCLTNFIKSILLVNKKNKKEKPLKLNMTFEEAMKKALNTPIPKGVKTTKKKQ
jgi:hypothetical protein